ncbi:MAG: SET domain-containing protein-lysine N-methyltransferase [Candidatus Eremiobacteraeota bacterium]|nr:SET domain-containing protein-lysine N-methyltransferase [Candidatus Eremiobacteraeota bacterium]MCW5872724.1 SET domain-containing protein-lysine N-methyltransferase [Candidatus Eremiobacteraeota bacterium]
MSLVRIGPSGWAGEGLFAAQPIPGGTRILQYRGEHISKEESARRRLAGNNYIFHLDYAHDIDGAALENTARYLNHSCSPNCRVELSGGQIWIVADRDLQAGEELSFNYGYDLSEYERFPCACGAPNCCGYMLAREYWGDLPQSRENYAWPGSQDSSSQE